MLFFFAIGICSCQRTDSGIVGKWKVDSVDMEFDEKRTSPQTILQYGEEEQHNYLYFKNDSIVHIKMGQVDGEYFYKVGESGEIFYKPSHNAVAVSLGTFKDKKIHTSINTVVGKIKVVYVRE